MYCITLPNETAVKLITMQVFFKLKMREIAFAAKFVYRICCVITGYRQQHIPMSKQSSSQPCPIVRVTD